MSKFSRFMKENKKEKKNGKITLIGQRTGLEPSEVSNQSDSEERGRMHSVFAGRKGKRRNRIGAPSASFA